MKNYALIICLLVLFSVNPLKSRAQNDSTSYYSELCDQWVERLEMLSNKIHPLLEKAISGKPVDIKQLVYLSGDFSTTFSFIQYYNDDYSGKRDEKIWKIRSTFLGVDNNTETRLLEGIGKEIIDESLDSLNRCNDIVIRLTKDFFENKTINKMELIEASFACEKFRAIISSFNPTPEQNEKKEAILKKFEEAFDDYYDIEYVDILGIIVEEKTGKELSEPSGNDYSFIKQFQYKKPETTDDALNNYKAFIEDLMRLVPDVLNGNMNAIQMYSSYVQEQLPLIEELQGFFPHFTPEQTKEMERFNQEYVEYINKLSSNLNKNDNDTLKTKEADKPLEIPNIDCYKIIDEYEEFLMRYVNVYRKAMDNNEDALIEMEAITPKLEALGKKLTDCMPWFSDEEIERLRIIAEKASDILTEDK